MGVSSPPGDPDVGWKKLEFGMARPLRTCFLTAALVIKMVRKRWLTMIDPRTMIPKKGQPVFTRVDSYPHPTGTAPLTDPPEGLRGPL